MGPGSQAADSKVSGAVSFHYHRFTGRSNLNLSHFFWESTLVSRLTVGLVASWTFRSELPYFLPKVPYLRYISTVGSVASGQVPNLMPKPVTASFFPRGQVIILASL